MDSQDLIDEDTILSVQLPGGQETTSTVHGSKPVMDVLVTLCAQHHLIPSDHVLKLISANQNHIHYKPNSPIGSLEFGKVVLQAKGTDDANRKKPLIPVATVRLMINYKKSHKAVLRVNPSMPLAELMPSVCEKCELSPDTTILLRMYQSEEPLDLTKTLNDYGIRELYAKDMKGGDEEQKKTAKEKNQREKGNKGFFSLFKKSKKIPEQALTLSASASSEQNNHAAEVTCLNGHSTSPTATLDMSKKRRAPLPPLASQSVACELNSKDLDELSERDHAGKQGLLSRIYSTESSLKRTKRRAPPPPCDGPSPSDADNKDYVEDDDNSSDKNRVHIADRCPAIAQVMMELTESLQARQQRALLSSVNSATSQHQTIEDSVDLHSEFSASEAEFKAPPGCQLIRNCSKREGLATFTVVPQRCQQSRKHFEVALALQAPDTAKAGAEQELSRATPEHLEIDSTELAEDAAQTDLDKQKHQSEVPHPQHLEKANQAQMDDQKIENLEHTLHLRNIKKGGLESFQQGFNDLESPDKKMNNQELRNAELQRSEQRDTWTSNLQPANKADGSPVSSNIEESLVKQEDKNVLVETGKERNWIEEYKEKRSQFSGGNDEGRRKLNAWGRIERALRNTQMKTMMQEEEDHFPSPPPPVCWCEDNSDGENKEKENKRDQDIDEGHFDQDVGLDSNPSCKPSSYLSKPNAHSAQSNPEPETYKATPEPPGNFLTSHPNSVCTSPLTSDPCSPETMSLFALAVFQKAKRFRPGPDRNHSKRWEIHTHSS